MNPTPPRAEACPGVPESATPTPTVPLRRRVLLALAELDRGEPVAVEALAVGCWERWPEAFGLRGYQHLHPDAAAVRAKAADLVAQGCIERPCEGFVRITSKGRAAVTGGDR